MNFNANYFALNAPSLIPNYPLGRQWFDLYPNGIYIADAGPKKLVLFKSEDITANQRLENTIREITK